MTTTFRKKRRWRRIGKMLLLPTVVFGITAVIAIAMNEDMAARICLAVAFFCGVLSLDYRLAERWKPGDPLPPFDPFDH